MLRHGSLFTGIGGFDLAAQQVNWQNIFHCEVDEFKLQKLKENFPDSESYGNIINFDAKKYNGVVDIISGGFPCQDVSISQQSKKTERRRSIKGKRTGLWSEYARIIRETQPGIIVFENSPMLLVRGFEQVLCDLHQLGYDVEWRCFYASDFGFPHFRKRIYGVAYSRSKRWTHIAKKGGVLSTVLPERPSRQAPISMSLKRFNRKSNYTNIRMDDGFSDELDKRLIHGFGNAIIPEIARLIFHKIETFQ